MLECCAYLIQFRWRHVGLAVNLHTVAHHHVPFHHQKCLHIGLCTCVFVCVVVACVCVQVCVHVCVYMGCVHVQKCKGLKSENEKMENLLFGVGEHKNRGKQLGSA